MASKIFLDANLLLDAYLDRAGSSAAQQILMHANSGLVEAHTTPAVLHIFDYFVSKVQSASWTRQLLVSLLDDVTIIDLDHSMAKRALSSGIRDVEDALQYFAALQHGLHFFLSADKKLRGAALPELPVLTASEFLGHAKLSTD